MLFELCGKTARPVNVSIPPDLTLIPFDPILLEQVLTNLIENII